MRKALQHPISISEGNIMNYCTPTVTCDAVECTSTVSLFAERYPEPQVQDGINKKKGKNPMYAQKAYAVANVEAPESDLVKSRRYLRSRVEDIFQQKKEALKVKYGLADDAPPASFDDFLARLTAGKYIYPEDKKTKKLWSSYGVLDYIRWRDPAKVEDQAGYDKAKAELSKLRDDTLDVINVLDEKAGLEAFKTFQAA